MGENGQIAGGRKGLRHRVIIAAGVFCLSLLIFHRPLLLFITRQLIAHYAAKENLKVTLQLGGNIFTYLNATNVHAVATGPSQIETLDAGFAQIGYSLFDFIRGRKTDFLRSVELRSARMVVNPERKKKPPRPAKEKPASLPSIFPERIALSDVSLVIRNEPHDLIVENFNLDLEPDRPGQLRIAKLQLPAAQTWQNLAASTSYTNRNLVVRDLKLSDRDQIALLGIDASRIASKQLTISFEARIESGVISDSTTLRETRSSLQADVRFQARNISADALTKYAGLREGYLAGVVEEAIVQGNGLIEEPASWKGTITARVNNFATGGIRLERGSFQASAADGKATLEAGDIAEGKNQLQIHGWATLPDKLSGFGRTPASFQLDAKDLDLAQLTSATPQRLSGLAQANGKIDIKDDVLSATFNIHAESIKSGDSSIEKANLNLTVSKNRPGPATQKAWFADSQSKLNLDISNIKSGPYVLDSVVGSLNSVNGLVQIDQLNVRRKQNDVAIQGQYQLSEDLRQMSRTGEIEFSTTAPELADFWAADSPQRWKGPLQGAGQIKWKNGIGGGQVWLAGANLRVFGLDLKQLNTQSTIANNVIYLNDVSATLDDQSFVRGAAVVDFWGNHHYTSSFSGKISDLSKLQPLLRTFGNQNNLAGSLVVDWQGGGDAVRFKNRGQLKLTLENGRYGNLKSLQASVDATYSPEALDVPTIFLRSDQMDFQAIVRTQDQTLEITKIQLDQGQAKYATGYVSIPFIWKNLASHAPVIPSNGNVIASFQSENIDIKKLFEDFGAKPLASGTLNVTLDAHGAVSKPDAHLEIEMRDLRSDQLPKLEPATFHLAAQSRDDQLTISGKLEQSRIQPIELSASFPFDLPRIARDGKLADDTPLKARVTMPRSSVNFIRQFIPAAQEVDGDVALDVNLEGTIARPVFKGQAEATVNVARASDPTLPALQNFKARLVFANDVLSFDQFAGELSGGHFNLAGRISIPNLTTANVDLGFKADSALIARSDTLTVRTDADVQLKGPINSVNVTGNVFLTNSHFLKNLDLIPISLPGRPPPQPSSARPQLVLPPQFHNWKFDVAIKTKDPVLIRGNLATGGAAVDLRFIGNGTRPGLDGFVRLENVEATLPFSRLEIGYGFLYFSPDDPLNPKIDLHGTSVIQDYTVHVYIYGTALAPQAIFSSEPPLPQEDLISLLSTGTTREQLTGNNNVLAGRAAMLLVQQLYRKVFKKGQATESNSVFDRFDLDVGTVDPRTGQQQATARFKINNQFVLVGDLGVGGDYKGMVKYLIRFH